MGVNIVYQRAEGDVVFIRKVVLGNNDMLSLELRSAMPECRVGFGSPVCKILGTGNNRAR
jgi:hypothetical protein